MRVARLEQALLKVLNNTDAIVFDENGEPLIFERKDTPKEIGQLRPVGEIDISHELELLRKYEGGVIDVHCDRLHAESSLYYGEQ